MGYGVSYAIQQLLFGKLQILLARAAGEARGMENIYLLVTMISVHNLLNSMKLTSSSTCSSHLNSILQSLLYHISTFPSYKASTQSHICSTTLARGWMKDAFTMRLSDALDADENLHTVP